MNRRRFLKAIAGCAAAAVVPIGALASVQAMPPIKYCVIPAVDNDKTDCLQSYGYVGGTIAINGEEYGVLYSAPWRAYQKLGRHEVERTLSQLVDKRLRLVWESLR